MYLFYIGLIALVLTACGGNERTASSKDEKSEQINELPKEVSKQIINDKKTVAIINGEKILGSEYNRILSTSLLKMKEMRQDLSSIV